MQYRFAHGIGEPGQNSSSRKTTTYDETKSCVPDKYGIKVSQRCIAQVKRKHGITEREKYNIGEGALKHFQMIG